MADERTLDQLARACQHWGLHLDFEYDNGKYISGEDAFDGSGKPIPQEDIPLDKVKQGPAGFTVIVSGRGYNGDDGKLRRYNTLEYAVLIGYRLVGVELRDRGLLDESKKV